MSTELQIAILGIAGTLLGTVLGWILNSFSQKGKVVVFVKKWEKTYIKSDSMGFNEACNYDEADYYIYNLSLDIYNSSRETRIMRDVQVAFFDKNKQLFSCVPKDDATRITSHSRVSYDDISVVNIPAKTVVAIDLNGCLNGSDNKWEYLSCANKVMLIYKNEKNRKNKVLLFKTGLE